MWLTRFHQVRLKPLPVWSQRQVIPSRSAATSPQQQVTPSDKSAGSTVRTPSSWRTSKACPSASAVKTPTCSSPPTTMTPATSPSRRCGLKTKAATAASLIFTPQARKKARHASESPVSLCFQELQISPNKTYVYQPSLCKLLLLVWGLVLSFCC